MTAASSLPPCLLDGARNPSWPLSSFHPWPWRLGEPAGGAAGRRPGQLPGREKLLPTPPMPIHGMEGPLLSSLPVRFSPLFVSSPGPTHSNMTISHDY